MALSPREMQAAIVRNLPERTGRTLEAWVREVRAHGPTSADRSLRAVRTAWLKQHHGLGHIQAQVIAAHAEDAGGAYEDPTGLFASLFPDGTPARLLIDQIVQRLQQDGPAIEVVPCRTYVGLRASTDAQLQFAVFKPLHTTARAAGDILVGLALPAHAIGELAPHTVPARARRGLGGSSRITHEIVLRDARDVDALVPWIVRAHDAARTT